MDTVMSIPSVVHVFRASVEGAGSVLDYTVLSVAVITLWLILLVELIRHRLDVAATGRPFFKAVLEGVYKELATLGIVEFFIFLLHNYYDNLNVAQELVFADVHFTLFYTALFNALADALLAFCSFRVSERLWVKTEQLEVDHYVEIREEFDRVEALLYDEKDAAATTAVPDISERRASRRENDDAASDMSVLLWEKEKAELAFDFSCLSISRTLKNIRRFIRYPHLYRKHQDLLVQIRFHELRVHFIQANDLPLTLKVSNYLKRCELQILIKMVHISTFAWLVLMGGVIVVYFLMGIVVFVSEDLTKVGDALTWIFLGANIFSVVLSLVIFNKMKAIFSTIMRKRLKTEDSIARRAGGTKEISSQQALFWGRNPKLIRAVIQSIQFGFALALSVLVVFWKDINVEYAPVPGSAFLLVVLSCYAAFLVICSQIIPRYTLCTSLGQMVNQGILQETLAQSRLEEAQRKQLRLKLAQEDYDYEGSFVFETSDDEDDVSKSSRSSSVKMGAVEAARKAIAGGLNLMGMSLLKSTTYEDIDLKQASLQPDAQEPPENFQGSREQRTRERKKRRKSMSEGVAYMRTTGILDASGLGENVPRSKKLEQTTQPARERRRSLSSEDKIKEMRRSPSFESALMSELVKTDTKQLRQNVDARAKDDQAKREQRMQARRNRRKSVSDGVTLMRHVMAEEKAEEGTQTTSDSSILEASVPVLVSSEKRERRRSVSASASIQQMRDTSSWGEGTLAPAKLTDVPGRRPRSRQSSIGAPRLEPLVEGVPAEHPESSPPLIPPDDVAIHQNMEPGRVSPVVDDKSTMEASTLGDGHSDVDDIPGVDPGVREHHHAEPKPVQSLPEIARSYFLSQKYKMISAFFGTMMCLFVVGMRVDALLIATCSMPDNKNTWHVKLGRSFWIETALLCCFIVAGILITILFRPGQIFSNRERVIFLGAAIDICLSGACLILLMMAESRRCCDDVGKRLLADAALECRVDSDCCPSFGQRFYGSVGTIEPFTSIVALRVLRFVIAEKIIDSLDKRLGWSDLDIAAKGQEEEQWVFNTGSVRKAHATESLEEATGTVVELWELALKLHPDIVEKHGEFSGEMLQAMLGIDIFDTGKAVPSEVSTIPRKEIELQAPLHFPISKPTHRRTVSVEKKYAGLTPEAQSIILAGKLGKSVRSISAGTTGPSGLDAASPAYEGKKQMANGAVTSLSPYPLVERTPLADKVTFELDTVDEVPVDQALSSFIAPNARLLRSMRRCDRKLPPLLDKWTVVDVVITKYEIVYFDASNVDTVEDMQSSGYTNEEISSIVTIRQAVVATKGGKGLRLRDVAVGRKVVGHLELSSVDDIHVERILPSDDSGIREELTSPTSEKDAQVEFWKSSGDIQDAAYIPRASRWGRIKQDRVMIHSVHGTLFLRFYSDLDDCEEHPDRCTNERESDGPIFKNNAFQWTQTIVRLCGINQLKEKLPHFGDDDDAELRDYLIVVDTNINSGHLRPGPLRRKSLGNVMSIVRHQRRPTLVDLPTVIGEEPPDLSHPDSVLRGSSFGASAASSQSKRSLRMLRRLSSTGDIPSERELSASLNASSLSNQSHGMGGKASNRNEKGADMV